MLRLLFTVLLAGGLTTQARACLNEYHTSLAGKMIEVEGQGLGPGLPRGRDLAHEAPANRQRLRELASLWRRHHRLSDYSDYGVTLVYLGRYEEARRVFEAIERQQPGLYATAANLGTAYELLGQNERALHWIRRAVQINPGSHQGSEWIHVNILQAKLSGHAGTRELLGTDFGPWPAPTTRLSRRQLLALRTQLHYQLTERLSFVRPPEPVVGRLLFDLGNLYALTISLEAAEEVYDLAADYGGGGPLRKLRRAYFGLVKVYADAGPLLLLPVLIIGVAGRSWHRRRQKHRAAARKLVEA